MSSAAAATSFGVLLAAAGLRRSIRRRRAPGRRLRAAPRTGLGVLLWSRSRRDDGRHALEQIHGLLRSGWSLFGAIGRVAEQDGPWSADARSIVEEVERGASVSEAIDRWAAWAVDPAATAFADAVALAGATGASQALAIESALAVIDERKASAQELRAATAQHRASAAALVAVPVAFAGFLCLVDPRVAAFYTSDPLGWVCIAAGASLDGAGAWWLRRLLGSVS